MSTMSSFPGHIPSPAERRRIEAGAAHLNRLGARAISEALLELAAPADLIAVLDSYSRLSPELLRLVGGDRFPSRLSPVPDDRRVA